VVCSAGPAASTPTSAGAGSLVDGFYPLVTLAAFLSGVCFGVVLRSELATPRRRRTTAEGPSEAERGGSGELEV